LGSKEGEQKEEFKMAKDYEKNVAGYVARKAIIMMFDHHKEYLVRKCFKQDVKYRDF
jgi:hypothetical protein